MREITDDDGGGIPSFKTGGPPCDKNDTSLASVAGNGRSPGFHTLDWLFVDIYQARAMAMFRAGALDELFAQADNNGVKDLMPWVRDYFQDDEDTGTGTRRVLVILAAVGDDEQAALLPSAYYGDQRARNLTHTLTTYAKTMVQRQIIAQHRPRHPSLAMFLPLCLATILLLARVMSDHGSAAPASSQPPTSFAPDNGGGDRSGDDLSGAVAASLHYVKDSIPAAPLLVPTKPTFGCPWSAANFTRLLLQHCDVVVNITYRDTSVYTYAGEEDNDGDEIPPLVEESGEYSIIQYIRLPVPSGYTSMATTASVSSARRAPPLLLLNGPRATSSSATLPTWPAPALPLPAHAPAPAPDDLALVATIDTERPAPAPAPPAFLMLRLTSTATLARVVSR